MDLNQLKYQLEYLYEKGDSKLIAQTLFEHFAYDKTAVRIEAFFLIADFIIDIKIGTYGKISKEKPARKRIQS